MRIVAGVGVASMIATAVDLHPSAMRRCAAQLLGYYPSTACGSLWSLAAVATGIVSFATVFRSLGVPAWRAALRIFGATLAVTLLLAAWQGERTGLFGDLIGLGGVLLSFAPVWLFAATLGSWAWERLARPAPGLALDQVVTLAFRMGVAVLAIGLVGVSAELDSLLVFADLGIGVLLLSFALHANVSLSLWLGRGRAEGWTVEEDAPDVVGGGAPPLFDLVTCPALLVPSGAVSYRVAARPAPIARVPADLDAALRALGWRAIAILLILSASGFALLGARAVSAPPPVVVSIRTPPPLRRDGRIVPSRWRGELEFGAMTSTGTYLVMDRAFFVLDIEYAEGGVMRGAMDWGDTVAEVRGTYDGGHLRFEDYAIRRTNGAPFILHDWKDVEISQGVMTGTDKGGRFPLTARRIQ
jgi:hypothetical protein